MENNIEGNNVLKMPEPEVVVPASEIPCAICGNKAVTVCANCKKDVCSAELSNLDVTLCIVCSPSVVLEINKESKREVDYDEWKDETKTFTFECKHVHVTGEKWLAVTTSLNNLTDAQLRSHIEFHKTYVSQLELEITTRKIKKSKAQIAVPLGPQRQRLVSVETTKTKTVRTKKIMSPEDQLAKLIAAAGGVDPSKLIAMLQQRVAEKKLKDM